MAKTLSSINYLTFAYISMFTILILLLLTGQIISGVAHTQSQHARAVVTSLNEQVLRTQRMFYHVLLLQSPSGTRYPIDYMAVTRQVQADEPIWEQAQANFSKQQRTGPGTFGFSRSGLIILATSQTPFDQMESAYHAIFALEQKSHPAPPDSVRPAVDVIYLNEASYVQDLIDLSSDLTAQADAYSLIVYRTDLTLSILCGVVVAVEAVFVARPAVKSLRKQMEELARLAPPIH